MSTVKEVIEMYGLINTDCEIEYRTYGPDGEDLLAGYCDYVAEYKDLISRDGDEYSLWDIVFYAEHNVTEGGKHLLTVWYLSKWSR